MTEVMAFLLLHLPALALGLPAICDFSAWCLSWFRSCPVPAAASHTLSERLLFLVPAHNEEALVDRCIASIRQQRYPCELLRVVVIADNCEDQTASVARAAGAEVLERVSSSQRGKHHAIAWALDRLDLDQVGAVILVDADTVVDPHFAQEVGRWDALRHKVIHSYVGASNEFENWFTRVAMLQQRARHDVALPLKVAAGLNCPLGGDGEVLGSEVLKAHPWRIETITEGWELYTCFTLAGVRIHYEPRARVYAQEARSFRQSESQRIRWTSGRLAVLRMYWRAILTRPGIPFLQRLDLLAELCSLGPAMRAAFGVMGLMLTQLADPALGTVLAVLFASAVVQPAVYSAISLARHPQRAATVVALAGLPLYLSWRVWVGLRGLLRSDTGAWVRTERHKERTTRA